MEDDYEQLLEYRNELIKSENDIQSDYDKAVMTLSGGALGITIPFLKDLIIQNTTHHEFYILLAWFFWVISIISIFSSLYTSQLSFSNATKIIDSSLHNNYINNNELIVSIIYKEINDSSFCKITKYLNFISGISFIIGVIFIGYYLFLTIKI
jgi:hypothetical protein